jgi:hypothetical protein
MGAIKEYGLPAIKTVGPMVLKAFLNRVLPNVEFGADSGGFIGDYSTDPKKISK